MVSSGARNLAKTVAQNETIAHAQAHAESLRKGTIQTRWHEQDWQKMSTRAAANANATGGVLAPETAAALLNGTQAMRDAGIKSGVQAVKAMRQERLRELYEREALQYEQELAAMGLALAKPRD